MNRTQIQGIALAFLAVILFSLSLPMTRWALESYSPLFTATGRAVIASVLAIIFLKIAGEKLLPPGHYREFFYTLLGAVFGWPILIALALMRTETAPVAVVASIMPLVTAIFAVLRRHENVSKQFWIASLLGTLILIYFTTSRGNFNSGDLIADFLAFGAVLASSFCYVQGAELTRIYPGWKVISWVVVMALPATLTASIFLWFTVESKAILTTQANIGLLVIGLSSMYLGFIPWYRGLKDAGTARGAQVQQLQVFMTLGWSVLILGEIVPPSTLICAFGIVTAVTWAIFSRQHSKVIEQTEN
ncbi:MAG: DMT family transporter [Actinomycetota bacterium]